MMKRLMFLAAAAALLMGASPHQDAYIISGGDGHTYSVGSSFSRLLAIRKQLSGRYIWVRHGGQEYVIRDEATIARAEELFRAASELGREQEAVNREEAVLDRQADRLADQEHLTHVEKERLTVLRERRRDVERREKELDRRQDELEDEAERAFWPLIDAAIHAGTAKPLVKPSAATRR